MEKKTFLRGQVIAREGQKCDKIYIIFHGEFEVYKKVKPQGSSNATPEVDQDKSNSSGTS